MVVESSSQVMLVFFFWGGGGCNDESAEGPDESSEGPITSVDLFVGAPRCDVHDHMDKDKKAPVAWQ